MITRRNFLKQLGHLSLFGTGVLTYGAVIEAGFMLNTTAYAFTPPRWTPGLSLRIVMLADPHCVEPQMPISRWSKIIAEANALEPDLILCMGDYVATHIFHTRKTPVAEVARAAMALKAPLGVYSINGNHDWWEDSVAQQNQAGPPRAQQAFEDAGIPVLANRAIRLTKDARPFWLAGTDSMVAFKLPRWQFRGADDLPGTLAQVQDDAPIIHLAHEPDLFVDVPERVSLTLSGHMHGGQLRIFGYSPITPSQYGNRFAYGHIIENGRHLVVSGGLGCSTIPVRIGAPPEITVLQLG